MNTMAATSIGYSASTIEPPPQSRSTRSYRITQHGEELVGQTVNNKFLNALENYSASAGELPLQGAAIGSLTSTIASSDSGEAQRRDSQSVDTRAVIKQMARAVIEQTATEWENAGVDPASIATIRGNPANWINGSESEQRAIEKFALQLAPTNEFAMLRKQAIRITRDTKGWQETLDKKVIAEPGVSRDLHEHRRIAKVFTWKNNAPTHDVVAVLAYIMSVNLATQAAEKNLPARPTEPAPAWQNGAGTAVAA